jgi:hypothetical protein
VKRGHFGFRVMIFHDLPIEVFLYLRNYLFTVNTVDSAGSYKSFEEKFVVQESKWSWNNFLSMSKNTNWQTIRRQTMVWSLNQFETQRYMTDIDQRSYINRRIADPSRQLGCFAIASSHFVDKLFDTNPISFLTLRMLSTDVSLSSIQSLRCLTLSYCPELTSLQGFPNLVALSIAPCDKLSFVDLPLLSVLRIENRTPEMYLSVFPLEQLKELSFLLCFYESFIDRFLPRFISLTSLELSKLRNLPVLHLPRLPIPTLQSLSVHQFHTVDLTGLSCLQTLKLDSVKDLIHHGDSGGDVFSQLKITVVREEDRSVQKSPCVGEISLVDSLPLLKKIRFLSGKNNNTNNKNNNSKIINPCRTSTVVDASFSSWNNFSSASLVVDSNIQNLEVRANIKNIMGVTPERCFQRVFLLSKNLVDISMFQKVQSLALSYCSKVTDISSLSDVPYLSIRGCPNIINFSCLGSQRYLEIEENDHLKNEDIAKFGNILALTLERCNGFTVGKNLWKNRFITFRYCLNMCELHLEGDGYLKVCIEKCPKLYLLKVLGRVYSCEVNDCLQLGFKDHSENCQYFVHK